MNEPRRELLRRNLRQRSPEVITFHARTAITLRRRKVSTTGPTPP
jgi:hypothetical protein